MTGLRSAGSRRAAAPAICCLCVLLLAAGASCAAVPAPSTPDGGGATTPPEPSATAGPVEWRADGVVTPGEYANELDNGAHHLFWSSTGETIRMAVVATTSGWVAVGFQPGSRMKNADIVLGMIVNGEVIVLDSYSTGDFGPHSADVEQGGTDDLLAVGGSQTGSDTIIEFERKLDTGDSRDVVLKRGEPVQVIWSYGSSDNEGVKHSARGYGEVVP